MDEIKELEPHDIKLLNQLFQLYSVGNYDEHTLNTLKFAKGLFTKELNSEEQKMCREGLARIINNLELNKPDTLAKVWIYNTENGHQNNT